MKNAVIICEFNPLHVGHKRLLDSARKAGAENVFCVMSGSAVQRGELACLDKYTRAKHAVLAGADVVVELPAEYSLSAAPQFALGGVKAANLIKDATLFFGSECGNISMLENAAYTLSDPEVNERIKALVKEGAGYPAAVAAATGNDLFSISPNNVLGIEYLKAINDTGRKISAYTVKRESTPDDDAPKGYPTSSSLRKTAFEGEKIDPCFVPSYVLGDIEKHPLDDTAYFSVIKYILTAQNASNVYDDTEGLSNRLRNAAASSVSFEDFCSAAASKRYTRARVKRLALNTAINNTFTHKELTDKPVSFLNVLAVAKGKENLLSDISVPLAVSRRTRAPFADEFATTDRADKLFAAARYPVGDNTLFVKR